MKEYALKTDRPFLEINWFGLKHVLVLIHESKILKVYEDMHLVLFSMVHIAMLNCIQKQINVYWIIAHLKTGK